jgi:hypothetical protein
VWLPKPQALGHAIAGARSPAVQQTALLRRGHRQPIAAVPQSKALTHAPYVLAAKHVRIKLDGRNLPQEHPHFIYIFSQHLQSSQQAAW